MIFKQSGVENFLSHLTSMVFKNHHHHHHHRRRTCDKNKWKSTLVYKYNVALVLTVGLKGCANFSSVQKAVDAAPERTTPRTLIIIDSGTYRLEQYITITICDTINTYMTVSKLSHNSVKLN